MRISLKRLQFLASAHPMERKLNSHPFPQTIRVRSMVVRVGYTHTTTDPWRQLNLVSAVKTQLHFGSL